MKIIHTYRIRRYLSQFYISGHGDRHSQGIGIYLRGLDLVQTAQDMQARGEHFDLVKFRQSEKLKNEVIAPLLEALEKQVISDLRPMLRKPLKDILKGINHKSKHIKGLALEALAFYLMRRHDNF